MTKISNGIVSLISLFFLFLLASSPSFASNPHTIPWKINSISGRNGSPSYIEMEPGKVGYGLAWIDDRHENAELYFALTNPLGQRIRQELRITDNSVDDFTPDLVWTGNEYGLFWSYSQSQIYFTRIDRLGRKIGADIPVVTTTRGYAIHLSAVWNGEEYGVTWWDARDNPGCEPSGTRGRAFFVRVSKTGEKIGEEISVSEAFSNTWQDYRPLLVWNGEEYVIFWQDSREADTCSGNKPEFYMTKANRSGEKITPDLKIEKNTPNAHLTSVIWDGSHYVMTYFSGGTGFLAKINQDGQTVFTDIPINSAGFARFQQITSYGGKYYVAWADNRFQTPEDTNNEIFLAKFDVDGNKLMGDIRITSMSGSSYYNTKLIFFRSFLGIAWVDDTNGFPQVYTGVNLTRFAN